MTQAESSADLILHRGLFTTLVALEADRHARSRSATGASSLSAPTAR
jgi:hypothetical protein